MPKDKIQESLDRLEDKLKLDQAVPVFETPKYAVSYIQNRLVEMKAASPEEAASRFYESISESERRGLFEALLIKEAEESGTFRKKLAAVYELSEGYAHGDYPYKTATRRSSTRRSSMSSKSSF